MNKIPIKQIIITTIIAIFLNLIDFGTYANILEPIWILIFLNYFLINFELKNEYFIALILGVIIDATSGNIIGQSSLALIVSSYFIITIKSSIKIANITTIIIFVAISSVLYMTTILAIHIIVQGFDLNYNVLIPIITTAMAYPLISTIINYFNGKNKRSF